MSENTLEHSAGGVVYENGRVLLILMQNLKGEKVWTFPKGHIENGETPQAAALREVEEETGYKCLIKGEIFKVHYNFVRNGHKVEKDVQWYLMEKISQNEIAKDNVEIYDIKWVNFAEAKNLLIYPSDFKIIEFLEKSR
jgi:8-oxo-dGTP pyrophosphatase MutT (NUDIX family)